MADTSAPTIDRNSDDAVGRVDAIVVGAGFSGLYMLHRLRQSGFTARGLDAASGVGGTWYWNRYPGARCDIESMQYSYQFSEDLQQEWRWPERYGSQPQILEYIEHVADRFDLKRDITFNVRVEAATFDEATHEWTVTTRSNDGEVQTWRSRYFIMSVGCLSSTIKPMFEGEKDYTGPVYHTGLWPHEKVDFTGKRVGIIGTGSSAIQAIPLIAEEAEQLFVFQRTPNYVVPSQNRVLSDEEVKSIKDEYPAFRARAKTTLSAFNFPRYAENAVDASPEALRERFEKQWLEGGLPFLGAFQDLLTSEKANQLVTEFWRSKVREIISDPVLAEKLIPKDDIFGCKRLCSGTGYYEAFNRDNVTLIDVSNIGIERLTPAGLRAEGTEYELDAIIYATGFDAMTGSVTRINIQGTDGQTIQDKWKNGPDNFLGMTINGFPNMFNMVGPGSPSVLATMVTCAEQHGDWIGDLLDWMREQDLTRFEVKRDAELGWVDRVQNAADGSLRSACNSWYVGSNVEGKARVFSPWIGGWPDYIETCDAEVASGYKSFTFEA